MGEPISVKLENLELLLTCKNQSCRAPLRVSFKNWFEAPKRCPKCSRPGQNPFSETEEEKTTHEHLKKLIDAINQVIREKRLLFDVTLEIPGKS